jgi:hypothetical protein
MMGLDWSLGVVDLRRLLAFQRRLSFDSTLPAMTVPQQCDWDRLIKIAFASPNPVICDVVHDTDKKTVILQSSNPNVQLRVTQDPAAPVAVYAGSPFFEIAQYAGRWFLRDGYHRAYKLLRAGIFQLPAVIVTPGLSKNSEPSNHSSSPRQSFFRNTPRLSATSSMTP